MSKDFLIGGTAAIVSRTATAPLELARLQAQNSYLKQNSILSVIRNEGIRHLWKGNGVNCIRIFPQYAMNFMIYQNTHPKINAIVKNDTISHLSSGMTSGIVSIMTIYPLETARSHLSLQKYNSKYSGLIDVFRKLSLRELYAGSKMTFFGYGPWNAINFASYNYYKSIFKHYEKDAPNIFKLLCGGFAGMTAISCTYPTDLIRRRLQLQTFSKHVPRYNGISDCFKKIIKQEGVLGIYRGLWLNYIKTFPTIAIQFYTLETLKDFFDKY